MNVDTTDAFSILHDGITSCELDSWIASDCHGFTAYVTLHEHGIYAWPLCKPKETEEQASGILYRFLNDVYGGKQ